MLHTKNLSVGYSTKLKKRTKKTDKMNYYFITYEYSHLFIYSNEK